MDYESLSSFNLVALHGGFGAASRASRRAKATLSRHVGELEQALGVRLVERGARLRLTEEGRSLFEHTHAPMLEIADAAAAIAGDASTPRGTLRVSAPTVLAHARLTRIGARFCARFPAMVLHLVAEDRQVDPVADGYDMVVRIDPAPGEQLVGRCIATDRRLLVAAPAFPVPDARDLPVRAVARIGAPGPVVPWRFHTPAGEQSSILPDARLLLSSFIMVRDACVDGAGVAQLPALLARPEIEAGRLCCWGEMDAPPVEIWALHPSRRFTSAKVRAFIALLLEELGDPAR